MLRLTISSRYSQPFLPNSSSRLGLTPSPQIIKIKHLHRDRGHLHPSNQPLTPEYTLGRRQAKASYQIPAMLHACHDSRAVALKTYRLNFEGRLIHPIYFDENRDSMMVMECFVMRAFHGAAWFADSRNIKGIRFVMLGGPRSISMVNFLFLFDALETVFVERPSLMVAGVQELTIHRVHTQWEFR